MDNYFIYIMMVYIYIYIIRYMVLPITQNSTQNIEMHN